MNAAANATPILLVEDERDDVYFMKRALKAASIVGPIVVAPNGEKAIEYLASAAARDKPPKLVFLDLKLPLRNGFEVLDWIRQQPRLAELDVIVLSSSNEECDRRRAGELGVRWYMNKPPLRETLRALWRTRAASAEA